MVLGKLLVICPYCKPIDERKSAIRRAQAVGVGVPKRYFKDHLELIHGITKRG